MADPQTTGEPPDALAAALGALTRFGVAYRAEGEASANTIRLWIEAIEAQTVFRKTRMTGNDATP